MADDAPASATAAVAESQAAVVDAAAAASQAALAGAAEAQRQAAVVAEHATEVVAEHAAQTEQRVGEALAAQEGTLEWLTAQAKERAEAQASLSSRLETMEAGQSQTQSLLEQIRAQLTPPASPPEAAQAPPSAGADGPPAAETSEAPAAERKRKHRWI